MSAKVPATAAKAAAAEAAAKAAAAEAAVIAAAAEAAAKAAAAEAAAKAEAAEVLDLSVAYATNPIALLGAEAASAVLVGMDDTAVVLADTKEDRLPYLAGFAGRILGVHFLNSVALSEKVGAKLVRQYNPSRALLAADMLSGMLVITKAVKDRTPDETRLYNRAMKDWSRLMNDRGLRVATVAPIAPVTDTKAEKAEKAEKAAKKQAAMAVATVTTVLGAAKYYSELAAMARGFAEVNKLHQTPEMLSMVTAFSTGAATALKFAEKAG